MNNGTKLDGALCAGVGTADVAAAAPAEGKTKYVSPTMQVIPLGPQRMLATSGEPVSVTINGGWNLYLDEVYNPIRVTPDDLKGNPFMPHLRNDYICGTTTGVEGYGGYCCYARFVNPYVRFGAGVPADWDEVDFLANVQFANGSPSIDTDDAYQHAGAGDTGIASELFYGTYRGRAVAITVNLSFTVGTPIGCPAE